MKPRFELSGDICSGAATQLGAYLAANPESATLFINSPGGDAFEGAALMAEVERHGNVTVHVQGIAASAATLPMVVAKRVIMHPAAMIMIHEPSAFTFGTADEHRVGAEALDKMTGIYAEAYARATGHPAARIAAWMKDETWLTADEALELRFCDEVEDPESKPVVVAAFDYGRFRNAPAELVAMARKNDWAVSSADSKVRASADGN